MIARVFPAKTRATPDDNLAFYGLPGLFPPIVDEVHISVLFSWDRAKAERLALEWAIVAPVKIGGPGWGSRGEGFEPGRYLRPGYVVTSRGCPNNCWFCSVPRREGPLRELPITQGWNLLDDNILACSEPHIRAVFAMLKNCGQQAELTGGLEAKRLQWWHVDLLADLKPKQFFFAYDTPDDWGPLYDASIMLRTANLLNRARCYVLVGSPWDTMADAESRLLSVCKLGIMPMAMLYRNEKNETKKEWRKFQRLWARPAIMRHLMK